MYSFPIRKILEYLIPVVGLLALDNFTGWKIYALLGLSDSDAFSQLLILSITLIAIVEYTHYTWLLYKGQNRPLVSVQIRTDLLERNYTSISILPIELSNSGATPGAALVYISLFARESSITPPNSSFGLNEWTQVPISNDAYCGRRYLTAIPKKDLQGHLDMRLDIYNFAKAIKPDRPRDFPSQFTELRLRIECKYCEYLGSGLDTIPIPSDASYFSALPIDYNWSSERMNWIPTGVLPNELPEK